MTLLEAYEHSLSDGEGSGRKPGTVYGVQLQWKPLDEETGKPGRKKTWFALLKTREAALKQYRRMKENPVESEEVTFFMGEVTWSPLELPE